MYKTITKNRQGREIEINIFSVSEEEDFNDKKINDVRAFCFYNDKMAIVRSKDCWNIPGGSVEDGESIIDATKREVLEETNMDVVKQSFVFLQTYRFVGGTSITYSVLSVCKVIPRGNFDLDPDGDILELKLIDPKDYLQYLDWWGERADFLMTKALEVLPTFK